MVEELFKELSMLDGVEAIALGGSRAGENFDEKSDYDVYLYCTEQISEDARRKILSKYCSVAEIGNHFWEYEDNCTLNHGIDIDILYRDLKSFTEEVASVVEKCQPHNGYTTCMWHNLKTCKVIYDKNGNLEKAKKRFDVPYPKKLKENIIERNWKLLHEAMPAYELQIEKAVKRGDVISISHRTAAFMESYFDILFALNEQTHPGEKRLVQLCRKMCKILPEQFEENLDRLFQDLFVHYDLVGEDIKRIIDQLEKLLGSRLKMVALDFDGTIADTIPMCIEAFQRSVSPYAGRMLSEEEIVQTFGLNEAGMIKAVIKENQEAALNDFYEEYKKLHERVTEPFPGIRDFIQWLKQKGVIVALITGKGQVSGRISLERLGLLETFDELMFGSEDRLNKKENIEALLKKYSVSAKDFCYIGDAVSDWEACQEAGVVCLSAAWQKSSYVKILEQKNPSRVFYTVGELQSYIENGSLFS